MTLASTQIREFVISVCLSGSFGRYLLMIFWFWDNHTAVFQSQMIYGVEYKWKDFCVSLNMKVFCEGLRRNIIYSTLRAVCCKRNPCNKTNPFPCSPWLSDLHSFVRSAFRQQASLRTQDCVRCKSYILQHMKMISKYKHSRGWLRTTPKLIYHRRGRTYFHEKSHNQGVDSNLNKYWKCALIS